MTDERLDAMIAIWTQDEAQFHGEFVDSTRFLLAEAGDEAVSAPVHRRRGTGSLSAHRPTECGWMAISPSPEVLAGQLEELHAVAGDDVPVSVSQLGTLSAESFTGYAFLGVERVVVELPTEPRDETLRRLDRLAAEFETLMT